jgi:hypothetical protein
MLTMLNVKWTGREHLGLASFWEDPWYLRVQRNKISLPYPPLRLSILLQDIVVHNFSR